MRMNRGEGDVDALVPSWILRNWHAGRLALLTVMVAGAGLAVPQPAGSQPAADQPKVMAVAPIDYADSSGEPRDQRAEHQSRLAEFSRALRDDLARGGKYRVVTVECPQTPCPPAELIEHARAAGASLLLYGGIHKMSTLIQNGKFQVVDLVSGQLVFDRLITFRGDTDDAWQRAEHFIAGELAAQKLSDRN